MKIKSHGDVVLIKMSKQDFINLKVMVRLTAYGGQYYPIDVKPEFDKMTAENLGVSWTSGQFATKFEFLSLLP